MMDIRLGTEGDIPILIELDHLAREDAEGRREFIGEVVRRKECHVACIDGKVVGYFVLNNSFFGNEFIEMLYIKEDSRGQGIGGELIGYMETLCSTEKLFTSTNLSNLRMQRLLEKKDFVISGFIRNLDEGDPEIIYVKTLDNQKID